MNQPTGKKTDGLRVHLGKALPPRGFSSPHARTHTPRRWSGVAMLWVYQAY